MAEQGRLGRELFDEHLRELEKAIRAVARAYRLGPDEAGKLYGDVMVKIIERDFAVLREFGGRCRWSTYLFVVARRVLLDGRARRWGRWRPSAAARRLGPVAVALDRRLNRDGLAEAEAVADVKAEAPATLDVEALAAKIPRRVKPKRVVADGVLEECSGPGDAEERVAWAERGRAAGQVADAVREGLRMLPRDDRELLALRFHRGWTVRRIAREKTLGERRLYARFQKILRKLRRELEDRGVSWGRVAQGLEAGIDLEFFGHGATVEGSWHTMSGQHTESRAQQEGRHAPRNSSARTPGVRFDFEVGLRHREAAGRGGAALAEARSGAAR